MSAVHVQADVFMLQRSVLLENEVNKVVREANSQLGRACEDCRIAEKGS